MCKVVQHRVVATTLEYVLQEFRDLTFPHFSKNKIEFVKFMVLVGPRVFCH